MKKEANRVASPGGIKVGTANKVSSDENGTIRKLNTYFEAPARRAARQ